MRRRVVLGVVVFGLLAAAFVLAPPGLIRRPPPAASPPGAPFEPGRTNIALVVLCTARADQMTPYGGLGTTPFLDRLSRQGTRFDATISPAPWTKPALTAIVTGRPAGEFGVTDPSSGPDNQRLPDQVETLAEHLKSAGYATVGGTANPNINAIFGFSQGIDRYYEATELWREGQRMIRGTQIVDHVLSQLPREGPWYAQMVLTDAHLPYRLDAWWWRWLLFAPSSRVAAYRSALTRVDAAIARFASGLEARGERDRTVFVVIGDHGEGLYAPYHHGYSHGFYLYPSTVRVPWVASGPGVARGQVVSSLASSIDLVPTVLRLAGITGVDLPGVAHDLAAGNEPVTPRSVYVETWFRTANRAAVYTEDTMCQLDFDPDGSERRAKRAGEDAPPFPSACYAWRADPDARQAVAAPELMERVRHEHRSMSQRRAAWVEQNGEPSVEVGKETTEALKSLGYAE